MKSDSRTTCGVSVVEAIAWGVAGLIARAVYVLWVVGRYGKTQVSDFLYMHELGVSLADGRGFTLDGTRIFDQSVGYPAFISLFYKLFGSDIWTALVVNVILGGISVALVYVLSLRIFSAVGVVKSRIFASVAAFLAVIYPDSLLYCALVSSENLLVPLMLLLVLGVLADWKNDWMAGIVVGVLAAVACSVKAHIMFFCLLIPLIWYVLSGRFLIRAMGAMLAAVICLMPWTLLNYRASGGHIIPFSSIAGTVMLDGTNPLACGKPTNQYHLSADQEKGVGQVDLDRLRMKQALKYIREDPLWYCKLSFKKALHAFSPARDYMFQFQEQDRFFGSFFSRWIPTIFNGFLLVAVLAGIGKVFRKKVYFVLAVCLFLAPLALQILFFAYSRYRFPFLFCLLPYCVLWLDKMIVEKAGN